MVRSSWPVKRALHVAARNACMATFSLGVGSCQLLRPIFVAAGRSPYSPTLPSLQYYKLYRQIALGETGTKLHRWTFAHSSGLDLCNP